MPITDFSVQPANILPGLGAMYQGVSALAERKRIDAEKAEAERLSGGLIDVLRKQDPDALFDFVSKNPGAIPIARELGGWVNEVTEKDKLDTAKRILAENLNPVRGVTPAEDYMQHAQVIDAERGDPTQTIQTAQEAERNPAYGVKQAEMMDIFCLGMVE